MWPLAQFDMPALSASCSVKEEEPTMQTDAWMTLVLAGLIIAAAALGLVRVIFHLVAVKKTLANVFAGVEVVAEKTSSVPIVLPSVNESLRPVREFCDAV